MEKTIQVIIEKVKNATLMHEIIFVDVANDGSPITKSITTAHTTTPQLQEAVEKAHNRIVAKNDL